MGMDMRLLADLHHAGMAVARIVVVDPLVTRVRWDDDEEEGDDSVRMARRALLHLAAFWPDSPVHCFDGMEAYSRACADDAALCADVLIEVSGARLAAWAQPLTLPNCRSLSTVSVMPPSVVILSHTGALLGVAVRLLAALADGGRGAARSRRDARRSALVPPRELARRRGRLTGGPARGDADALRVVCRGAAEATRGLPLPL